ncbi:MAG: hypothetical protein HUU15_07850 [Candidatus Brocadiae bacterium]|nr:hypothetical protein [Candidatus Brocadiia bacterium]
MLARSSRGEIDYDQLRTVDTLAGLDDHLRASLHEDDFQVVAARLGRRSRNAAESAARALVRDLQARAELDQAQATQIESLLVDRTAWRRDLPFLPEVARDALVARHVSGDGVLRAEFAALLSSEQQVRVTEFIAGAETARARYWEQLRTSHRQ